MHHHVCLHIEFISFIGTPGHEPFVQRAVIHAIVFDGDFALGFLFGFHHGKGFGSLVGLDAESIVACFKAFLLHGE